MRGLIRALGFVVPSNSPVIYPLDPFGQVEDSITKGNVEVGDSSVVLFVAIGGPFEHVLIVFDMVVESTDLFFEAANFACFLGIVLGNGCEEPFSDGSEDVCIEIGVGHQGGCNCTR